MMQVTLSEEHPRVVEFLAAEVEIWPFKVVSRFLEDGSVSEFWPPVEKPSFREAAAEMGYSDPMRYGLEHDLAHHLLAEVLGWPHSRSIWADAHGRTKGADGSDRPMPPSVAYDEHLTNRLQRWVNLGTADPFGALEYELGDRMPWVGRRLLELARPWLGIKGG